MYTQIQGKIKWTVLGRIMERQERERERERERESERERSSKRWKQGKDYQALIKHRL